MKVAVVGGGIFGCTAAIYAARAGHEVHLFERGLGLMQAASAINQFRLHRGYHYPRSPETTRECLSSLALFRAEYGECLIEGRTIYAIAANGSRVSAVEYLQFCDRHSLPYHAAAGPFNEDVLSVAIAVPEDRIDPHSLSVAVKDRMRSVHIHLNTPASSSLRNEFDVIVIAAYASTNDVALELGCAVEPFQYEVVEKPVVKLPGGLKYFSIVVMDGEFCCLDPFGNNGLHVMGHVKNAIHHTSMGLAAEVPEHLAIYLNRGIVQNQEHTRFPEFIGAGKKFMPFLSEAEHIGSMFTVRAVLPERDATDERPTLVERLDDQVIRIFSGKIGTAVMAASKAVGMIGSAKRAAA